MTLREAIEKGLFRLDEEITVLAWDPDCPESPVEPEDMLNALGLDKGDTFELWRGLQCAKSRSYRVVARGDEVEEYEQTQPIGGPSK